MIRYIKYMAVLLGALVLWNGCTKEDEYKKYIEGGERVYAGRPDSLHIHSGKNRAMLSWLLIADPKIVSSKIRWNNGKDSLLVPVTRTSGIDTIEVMIGNLPEGTYNFDVTNYDKLGNVSVPRYISGKTYGEKYESFLFNRGIRVTSKIMKGPEEFNLMIVWNEYVADLKDFMVATVVSYIDIFGVPHQVKVDAKSNVPTILPDFKAGESFSYRSLYLPDSLAIDTFATRPSTVKID
ncbi:DUF4998 domain-containing protein [Pararcticibacter amylolyticus]|uniref:DUF4998 domain-containing protein n=1 Tax=Pararcticibacter amylolyticus TaxID=2173175 RepID=A0A2U2PDB5_9SPHI|nr:DUF4998 domain-containing protein [Pararcticibacter amylolyticus]PWG79388.1 hypothetical protein DDR33_17915 [Pararcticibacter amylolyticus]